jgi:hypothetical protein
VDEHVAFMKKALSRIETSQHAISTTLLDVRGRWDPRANPLFVPMVLDFGNGKAHIFFRGSWYRD